MMEDFIVPCLAAVVFARPNAHDGQRAVARGEESARVVPDHIARGRLGAVQLSRHTQTGHFAPLRRHWSSHFPGRLNLLDTSAWNVVKREMVAVRSRQRRRGLGLLCVLASNLGVCCMIGMSACRCALLPTVALLGTFISSGSLDL